MGNGDDVRREALGLFLSQCRKALPPPAGGRRRTPGWRREEVAAAAGISTTWFTWLEQGRDITMSDHALARLGRALRLDATQTQYLFELARPGRMPVSVVAVDPELRAFIEGLSPLPAYVLDRGWGIVTANDAARAVLSLSSGDSLAEKLFLDATWTAQFENRAAIVESSVAQYRASVGGRPEYRRDVERYIARSDEFARHWRRGVVEGAPLWQKVLNHSTLGQLRLRYASLGAMVGQGLTVSIYTPADSGTRAVIAGAVASNRLENTATGLGRR